MSKHTEPDEPPNVNKHATLRTRTAAVNKPASRVPRTALKPVAVRAPAPAASDLLHLQGMLAAAIQVRDLVAECTPDTVVANPVTRLAIERLLQRVSDAAQRVSPRARRTHQELPWERLDRLCDTISTTRESPDGRIVYAIVAHDAPSLIDALQRALPGDDD